MVQVQAAPTLAAPPTLFVLVAVRSEPTTVTVLAQALFASPAPSATLLFGSTVQAPPARGLAKTPRVFETPETATRKAPPGGSETVPPFAMQVSLTVKSISQVSGPLAPPVGGETVGVP